jgi:hypothetical protein
MAGLDWRQALPTIATPRIFIITTATQPPYKLDARCSEINNAPNAIFNWDDFGDDLDPTAYAIDIYRTSYTLPDESKDLAAGLPYQPYNYGLVGTLYKDRWYVHGQYP